MIFNFNDYSILTILSHELLYMEYRQIKRIIYNCREYKDEIEELNQQKDYIIVVYGFDTRHSEESIRESFESSIESEKNLALHLKWWNDYIGIQKLEIYESYYFNRTNKYNVKMVYTDYIRSHKTWDFLWDYYIQSKSNVSITKQIQIYFEKEDFFKHLQRSIYEYVLKKYLSPYISFITRTSKYRGYSHEISLILDFMFD